MFQLHILAMGGTLSLGSVAFCSSCNTCKETKEFYVLTTSVELLGLLKCLDACLCTGINPSSSVPGALFASCPGGILHDTAMSFSYAGFV